MESNYTDTISGEELYVQISSYGSKFYYKDKKKTIHHRVDGPAIEYVDGAKYWSVNGKSHRIDGPAFEYSDGSKHWYINGVFIFGVVSNNKLSKKMR
jgi:hypothetical protein